MPVGIFEIDLKGERRKEIFSTTNHRQRITLPIHDLTTVGMDELTCNKSAIIGGKEQVTWGNFSRLTGAGHGDITPKIRHFFWFKSGCNQWCPHWTRRYAIHPYLLFYKIGGKASGETDDGPFCGSIIH